MTKRGLLVVLPDKTFRLTSTWVAKREGSAIRVWSSSADHRRGIRSATHTQHFEDEDDARGAQHLFTEAALYANACGDGRVDLRGFCFWDDDGEVSPSAPVETPRPKGITLSSLVTRKGR